MPHLCGSSGPRKQVCGGCNEDCLYDGIFCDVCETWRHVACEKLGVKEQQTFRELPPDFSYICITCRSDSRGSFSFEDSLKRLHKAAKQGYEKLEASVIREKVFMKDKQSFTQTKAADPKVDAQAQVLIEKYVLNLKSKPSSTPVKTSVDGNSLFSAVSLALIGKEKLATELRVRCCIEMVTHAAFYQWQKNHELLSQCAPDYIESCLNCATPYEESCIWIMSALASVIGSPIRSIYPAVNGREDRAVSVLNTQFFPRQQGEDASNENIVRILWSSKKPAKTAAVPGSWVPDHFVPLVEVRIFQSPVMTSLQPSRVSGRKRKLTSKLLEFVKREPDSDNLHMEIMVQDDDHDDSAADPEAPSPTKRRKRKNDDVEPDFDWQRKYTHDAVGGMALDGSNFLPIRDVFHAITTTKDPLPSISRGRKNDIYFVVDNSKNMRHPNRRNYFADDCGRYKQRASTMCKSWYLYKGGNICALNKVDDKYCKESKQVTKTVKGRSVKEVKWIPMVPQPEEDSLMLLHRYYAVLQCDPFYRRRISWFSILPSCFETGRESMVVEYLNKPRAGKCKDIGGSSVKVNTEDSEGEGEAEASVADHGAEKDNVAETATTEEEADAGSSDSQTGETERNKGEKVEPNEAAQKASGAT